MREFMINFISDPSTAVSDGSVLGIIFGASMHLAIFLFVCFVIYVVKAIIANAGGVDITSRFRDYTNNMWKSYKVISAVKHHLKLDLVAQIFLAIGIIDVLIALLIIPSELQYEELDIILYVGLGIVGLVLIYYIIRYCTRDFRGAEDSDYFEDGYADYFGPTPTITFVGDTGYIGADYNLGLNILVMLWNLILFLLKIIWFILYSTAMGLIHLIVSLFMFPKSIIEVCFWPIFRLSARVGLCRVVEKSNTINLWCGNPDYEKYGETNLFIYDEYPRNIFATYAKESLTRLENKESNFSCVVKEPDTDRHWFYGVISFMGDVTIAGCGKYALYESGEGAVAFRYCTVDGVEKISPYDPIVVLTVQKSYRGVRRDWYESFYGDLSPSEAESIMSKTKRIYIEYLKIKKESCKGNQKIKIVKFDRWWKAKYLVAKLKDVCILSGDEDYSIDKFKTNKEITHTILELPQEYAL